MPEKPSKITSALYGGLIMGAISGLPVLNIVNCLCCAGILLGGFLSVMFYRNELTPTMPPLTSSDGMQLGALAGVFGALFGSILHVLTLASVGDVTSGIVLDILKNMNLPPEAMDAIEQSIEQSGALTAFVIVKQVLISLVIDPLFGLLGGLIGFNIFKPKTPMMNMPPSPPPATQS